MGLSEAKKRRWHEEHEADRARRRDAKAAQKAAKVAAWHADHIQKQAAAKHDDDGNVAFAIDDPFVVQMARDLGLTPQGFLDLQAKRRAEQAEARANPNRVIPIVSKEFVPPAEWLAEEEELRRQ